MQNTVPVRGTATESTLDIEQGHSTPQEESSTPISGVGVACAGLAAVIFAVGAGVCIATSFGSNNKEDCMDGFQNLSPCPDNSPSFGLLATGIGLAFGAVFSGAAACALLAGKPVSDVLNTGGARTHRNHTSASWMGSSMNFGTQSAAGAFGGGMGM